MNSRAPELAQLLRLVNRSVERKMLEGVANAGLEMLAPRHLTLLRVLDPGEQGMRISDLARDADVTRQSIQQVADELERFGFVETLRDPNDARARLIRYTPAGRAGYLRSMEEFAKLERAQERRLGTQRMHALKDALRNLLDD